MFRWLRSAVDFILPPTCLSCDQIVADAPGLCPTCWQKLNFITHPLCCVCGHPFPIAADELFTCARCLTQPPPWTLARAVLCYDAASKPLILRFKHADRLDSVTLFTPWMLRAGTECLNNSDLILPVPLHPWRLWRRRYNQAAELGRAIARHSGLPMRVGVLRRRRATTSQGHLSVEERRKNVRGAFYLPPHRATIIENKRVLLVDDVLTTGATTGECARTLLQAGAKQVNLLTLARVITANL